MPYSCEKLQFPSLVLPRTAMMLQRLIVQLWVYNMLSDRLPEVKQKKISKFQLVMRARSLTRGGRLYHAFIESSENVSTFPPRDDCLLFLLIQITSSEIYSKLGHKLFGLLFYFCVHMTAVPHRRFLYVPKSVFMSLRINYWIQRSIQRCLKAILLPRIHL